MFQTLPKETIFEVQKKNRRATVILFGVLLLVYIVFFNLLATIFGFIVMSIINPSWFSLIWESEQARHYFLLGFNLLMIALSVMVAAVHFSLVRKRPLVAILCLIGGQLADDKDTYHKRYINIIHEVEVATGIMPILPVVLPSLGVNAFSIQDGRGYSAIGVTEGLLAQLNPAELSAVVAHEAAHLLHEDAKVVTTACSLFWIFDFISRGLQKKEEASFAARLADKDLQVVIGISILRSFFGLIAGIGALMSRLTFMAISRKREFLADAHGVQMCKDPLALVEALQKISGRYRGSVDVPLGFSPVFILNPQFERIDEQDNLVANLFSTHPPVGLRIKQLLSWAKADISVMKRQIRSQAPPEAAETNQEKETMVEGEAGKKFFVSHNNTWKGPYTPIQMLALNLLTPTSWVSPYNSEEMFRAGDNPLFLPLFENQLKQKISPRHCPRCKVALMEYQYEGAPVLHCFFCGGYLVKIEVLARIIARRQRAFPVEEINKTKEWRKFRMGGVKELNYFPLIYCPACGRQMAPAFHSQLTKVVIDKCIHCRLIWFDADELERIQILVEEASKELVKETTNTSQ